MVCQSSALHLVPHFVPYIVGKMEFLPGQEYNLSDDEKKAVLWRYRVKEILKKEYLRREYDPHNFKYKVRYEAFLPLFFFLSLEF